MCAVFRPAVSTATEIVTISEDQSSSGMKEKIGKNSYLDEKIIYILSLPR